MAGYTTLKDLKAEQCRQNALAKSARKRQDALDAISFLQQKNVPVTKKAVVDKANVSYPFLSKHPDLVEAIEAAGKVNREHKAARLVEQVGKDQVISALQRRLDKSQQQVQEKDSEIRRQQREIEQLYGKLAIRK